jgi:hypothetical protein
MEAERKHKLRRDRLLRALRAAFPYSTTRESNRGRSIAVIENEPGYFVLAWWDRRNEAAMLSRGYQEKMVFVLAPSEFASLEELMESAECLRTNE